MRPVVLVALVLCACSGAPAPSEPAFEASARVARQRDASKYHRLVDESPRGWVAPVDDGTEAAPPPVPPSTSVCTVKGQFAPFGSCEPRKVPVAAGRLRGRTLATFVPEGVRMTWAVLKDERRGLWIDVRDDEFILTGYVDGAQELFLARRDVEVVSDRAWILAGARIKLAGGSASGVAVRVEDEQAGIEGIDLQVPCDAIAYDWTDVSITPVTPPEVEPAMYATPVRDVLPIYSTRDGEVLATLRAREKPWPLAIEIHEHATPWARVTISTGSMRFEGWTAQADLGSDTGSYGIGGGVGCGRSSGPYRAHTRAAVAPGRVTVAAAPHEASPEGLVILRGAAVHVLGSRDGFYKIEPVSSTMRPPSGASFWVPHEVLDGP